MAYGAVTENAWRSESVPAGISATLERQLNVIRSTDGIDPVFANLITRVGILHGLITRVGIICFTCISHQPISEGDPMCGVTLVQSHSLRQCHSRLPMRA